MAWLALFFNVVMLLWLLYEALAASGAFGTPSSNFPLGSDFGIIVVLFFWGVGNILLLIVFLIRRFFRR